MADLLVGEKLVVGWRSETPTTGIKLVWTNKKRLLMRSRGTHSVLMPKATWEDAQALANVRGMVIALDKRKAI